MSTNYHAVERCRISGSTNLISVLNLGMQELTGVFPKPGELLTCGPLNLVWCPESGLLQLAHSYDPNEMYGDNYGYRSGLNNSMVQHLTRKINFLEQLVNLRPGDTVLDIGSNDATSLMSYRTPDINRIGIDPTGSKFQQYYPADIRLVSDFFSADKYRNANGSPAKIVTSIAMFYDLDDPISFAKDIASILDRNGVWHFEQSYMPAMLRTTSYDTICHEHLEYYSLAAVRYIVEAAGLQLIDVQMNSINGGSFAVTAALKGSVFRPNHTVLNWLLDQESRMGLSSAKPFRDFEDRVYRHREDLTRLLKALAADGKKVMGYGASTKGNVTLQFCGITEAEVKAIAEVNPEKYGRVTPGSRIPIISESEARAENPDYFLVLPWHFKESILAREVEYRTRGGRFIFPFPEIEII